MTALMAFISFLQEIYYIKSVFGTQFALFMKKGN